jgi:hypothetical protein
MLLSKSKAKGHLGNIIELTTQVQLIHLSHHVLQIHQPKQIIKYVYIQAEVTKLRNMFHQDSHCQLFQEVWVSQLGQGILHRQEMTCRYLTHRQHM